ncbi:MAG: leucyl aminopeptidase [Lachnospiraceae bacterium]|nr:leucyl aminopeptidase [Lachnospiraceae bacterium]MDY5742936.1 leucyl aminopeptidase [Lachnospiraceae bacterium]
MNFSINRKGAVEVVFLWKEEEFHGHAGLEALLTDEVISGKRGETYLWRSEKPVLALGLGNRDCVTTDRLREAFYKLGKKADQEHVKSLTVPALHINGLDEAAAYEAAAEGLLHSTYRYDVFKSEKKTVYLETVSFSTEDEAMVLNAVREAELQIKGIFTARDLINEPAMYMTPTKLAERAIEILNPLGVKVTVLEQSEIEELGMTAFLAVAKGSAQAPKLVVMEYQGGAADEKPLALVGKGLTYDSGGYCIKTPSGMETMNSDMGGAATVIGAMQVIALQKLPKNVVAVVAACENMISGDAYKTGDIIHSMAGKTIEIINTDAEGRLTLADAVYYTVNRFEPTAIVDAATLTGACLVALGELYTALISNNVNFAAEVLTAAGEADELIWQLPSHSKFGKMNHSERADLKNSGGRIGGTISAGLFVGEFVGKTPWAHLDIAGTAYLSKADGYLPKNGTGSIVKTLAKLAANHR